jgi:hypothetical protein
MAPAQSGFTGRSFQSSSLSEASLFLRTGMADGAASGFGAVIFSLSARQNGV